MIKTYKLDSKTYYLIQLSYTAKNGKRFQRKFRRDPNKELITSIAKAKKLEAHYLVNLESDAEGLNQTMKFKEWHELFLKSIKHQYKRITVMQYDGDLKKWLSVDFQNRLLSDFMKSDIHSFIFNEMSMRGATPHQQGRILRHLHRLFEAALEDGLISRNPAKGIKVKVPPPQKLVLNTNEAELLLEEAKKSNHDFYYLWAFALLTGMRSGEMYGLRWTDVDEVTGNISISRQWTNKDGYHATKTNLNRVLPISSSLKHLLSELKNIGPFKETLIGLNNTSVDFDDLVLPRLKEWRHGNQSLVTNNFCKSIGVTEVKFHDLRATFITNLLAQGVSLAKVMSIVGHSKTSTTDVYLRLAGVDVRGSTDQLGYSLPKEKVDNVVQLFS
ncbi:MAG: hypothetical protein A2381_13520 [Bdellovibrionales bacterium RIFOXYB1_FULL_37_110]|nr:MAG: hypothetical protein A2417_08180 [Bdellovibrionales bacterium RIFOXYC1_FULL_37_79]OFZ59465.1 MAG: hypothetical protein A2381_13520 [Bdellovibrionales bacterium RIFOXYB1_FULL_37_110]OFZ64312.1 MAG: hypothetical protein A2577_02645 [Bdellovibrionales bacterium RIFOXYD1_FULL_36_51]